MVQRVSTEGQYSTGWYATKWEQFLRSYVRKEDLDKEVKTKKGKPKQSELAYYYNYIIGEMFTSQSMTFVFDYKDMEQALAFGAGPSIAVVGPEKTITMDDLAALDSQIRENTNQAHDSLREAVYKIMKEVHHDYAMEIKDDFKARFKNTIDKIELSDITHRDVGHLFTFDGFVTAVDESTRLLYKTTTWQCSNNHNTEVEGRTKPRKCDTCEKEALWQVNAITETYQEFRLQQRHDHTKDGRIAVERDVVCIGNDIVNIVQGGDYIELSGIVKVREKAPSSAYRKKNSDVVDFYIEASWIEKKPDDTMMTISELDRLLLEDKVAKAVHPDTEQEDFEKLCNSFCPTVIGHEVVKMALILQMASSDSRTFIDGTPHRGNLVLAFCGSPASAKTLMARFAFKVHIRAVFPTGEGLTKAGLTAAVNTKVEPKKLEAGAYLMAKNGICIIDELQTLKQDVLDAILEVTEDAQTITITKAGIHRPMKADCASLHLSNPKDTSYWDDSKNIMENTGFKANLLSRYDAIMVFRDIPNPEEDQKRAEHWMRNYTRARKDYLRDDNSWKAEPANPGVYSAPFMAMWLRYVRKTFHPTLNPHSDAYKIIQDFYLTTRKTDASFFSQSPVDLEEQDDKPKQKIPSITMRQLASLIRWAEASARAHHRNEVTEVDAQIACQIVAFSILNSGFNPITKSAHATEDLDEMSQAAYPRIRLIDVERYAAYKRDLFFNDAIKKVRKLESALKRYAIGKCMFCKGTGVRQELNSQDVSQSAVKCIDCNGLGSTKLPFLLSDVEDVLHREGFTRADMEWWEQVLVKNRILTKDSYGQYWTVKQYSMLRGMKAIKMVDMSIEQIFDVDGRFKKMDEVAENLPQDAIDKINEMKKRIEQMDSE